MKFKNSWKILLTALIITTTACGQQRGGGQRGGQQAPPQLPNDEQVESMVSDLSKEILLSDEQESEILELYKNHFNEMEEITKSGRPDRDEMGELKEELESDVSEVLTEDQQELFQDYLKKKSKSRPQRRQRSN